MKKRIFSTLLIFSLIISLFAATPLQANAASTVGYFNSYADVAAIKDSYSCTSMQGFAVGSTYLYSIKIKTDDSRATISKTNRTSGSTTLMTNSSTGNKYITGIHHANDMGVCSVDGYSNLFVATGVEGSSALVRLQVDGSSYKKLANFTLKYNGTNTMISGVEVLSKTDTEVTLLCKKAQTFYTAVVPVSKTSGTINLTKRCTIDKSAVTINGKVENLSSYINQGFGYHRGRLYVPICSDTNKAVSVVAVYIMQDGTGTLKNDPNLSFRITSGTYAALFEIEGCGIAGDGKLYFNTNRRKSSSDCNHDGVHYFKDFEEKTYTVKYNANGGTGTMSNTTVYYKETTALRANSFKNSGKSFTGWYAARKSDGKWLYSKNGSDKTWYEKDKQPSGYTLHLYGDKANVSAQSSVDADTVTLYAQWRANTYTLTYNAGGGTGEMPDFTVTYGTGTPLPENTLEKTGYKFAGWNAKRKSDGKWLYSLDGADKSWYDKDKQPEGYTLHLYVAGNKVSAQSPVDKDIVTMYAQWIPNTYTLTYNANGGAGEMPDLTVTYGTGTPLPENTFERPGYACKGWYATRQSDGKWLYSLDGADKSWYDRDKQPEGYTLHMYTAGSKVSAQSPVDNDIVTMLAQWELTAEKGDVNLDGEINIKDATAIQKLLSFSDIFPSEMAEIADFNNDGAIDIVDVTAIQKYLVGLF